MQLRIIIFTIILAAGLPAIAQGGEIEEKVNAAMAADVRGESDTSRDRNRRPLETLQFFGLNDDMKVVELLPGGGWYTKILAPVLADNGELVVSVGTSYVKDNVLNQPGFDKVVITGEDAKIYRKDEDRFYTLELESLGGHRRRHGPDLPQLSQLRGRRAKGHERRCMECLEARGYLRRGRSYEAPHGSGQRRERPPDGSGAGHQGNSVSGL